jgi:hypothetical protein
MNEKMKCPHCGTELSEEFLLKGASAVMNARPRTGNKRRPSPEEAREMGRKGGLATAAKRQATLSIQRAHVED